jgi:hypothetical protein
LCGILKFERCHKKRSLSFTFIEEILDMVARHEFYSFLNDFLGYHQEMIISEDKYKTTFITIWGTFVWIVMPFGLKNVPQLTNKQ